MFAIKVVKKSTQTGFTLIELLLTITIIGILATIVLVAINPAQRIQEANDAHRKSDLAQMNTAIVSYSGNHTGIYPSTAGVWQCDDCGISDWPNTTFSATNWIPSIIPEKLIKLLPHDPNNGQSSPGSCIGRSNSPTTNFGYVYISDGIDYKLTAYCTPKSNLNSDAVVNPDTTTSFCPTFDVSDADFISNPPGVTALKPLVDPRRPTYAYALYSKGYTCK